MFHSPLLLKFLQCIFGTILRHIDWFQLQKADILKADIIKHDLREDMTSNYVMQLKMCSVRRKSGGSCSMTSVPEHFCVFCSLLELCSSCSCALMRCTANLYLGIISNVKVLLWKIEGFSLPYILLFLTLIWLPKANYVALTKRLPHPNPLL